ncbi:MAG TPA: hypothetical protein VIM77_12015 [Mucilaginibacter sp.]
MALDNDWLAYLSIRINTHNLPALMTEIEKIWKTIAPNEHFDYSFMDDDDWRKYERQAKSRGYLCLIIHVNV